MSNHTSYTIDEKSNDIMQETQKLTIKTNKNDIKSFVISVNNDGEMIANLEL